MENRRLTQFTSKVGVIKIKIQYKALKIYFQKLPRPFGKLIVRLLYAHSKNSCITDFFIKSYKRERKT